MQTLRSVQPSLLVTRSREYLPRINRTVSVELRKAKVEKVDVAVVPNYERLEQSRERSAPRSITRSCIRVKMILARASRKRTKIDRRRFNRESLVDSNTRAEPEASEGFSPSAVLG